MAANTTYIIYNTAGAAITAIQPNTLNGPGGVQQSSDLRMYGLGFPNWGEGVNENDYHVVENFACPSLSEFPASVRYGILGPAVAAVTPAGQAIDELGEDNGINVPLVGQLWFNTTTQKMFVYTATGGGTFVSVEGIVVATGTAPVSPNLGDLWYDGVNTQLKIYDISTGGWTSVAGHYLPLTGGTITGPINMSGNAINGIPTAPPLSGNQLAANTQYVDNAVGSIAGSGTFVLRAGDTMVPGATLVFNGGTALNIANAGIAVANGTLTFTGSSNAINTGGGRVYGLPSPSSADEAINFGFADSRYLVKDPIGFQTIQNVIGLAGNYIKNVANPVDPQDAATKAYVDMVQALIPNAQIQTATFTYSPTWECIQTNNVTVQTVGYNRVNPAQIVMTTPNGPFPRGGFMFAKVYGTGGGGDPDRTWTSLRYGTTSNGFGVGQTRVILLSNGSNGTNEITADWTEMLAWQFDYTSFYGPVTGLSPNTTYTFNVGARTRDGTDDMLDYQKIVLTVILF